MRPSRWGPSWERSSATGRAPDFENQRACIVFFFEDEDPTRTQMRFAICALQELWRRDNIEGLLLYLESVTEILVFDTMAQLQNEIDFLRERLEIA